MTEKKKPCCGLHDLLPDATSDASYFKPGEPIEPLTPEETKEIIENSSHSYELYEGIFAGTLEDYEKSKI